MRPCTQAFIFCGRSLAFSSTATPHRSNRPTERPNDRSSQAFFGVFALLASGKWKVEWARRVGCLPTSRGIQVTSPEQERVGHDKCSRYRWVASFVGPRTKFIVIHHFDVHQFGAFQRSHFALLLVQSLKACSPCCSTRNNICSSPGLWRAGQDLGIPPLRFPLLSSGSGSCAVEQQPRSLPTRIPR